MSLGASPCLKYHACAGALGILHFHTKSFDAIFLFAFACFVAEKEYPALCTMGRYLTCVSGINCENWGAFKLASAFNIICTHDIGGSDKMFSKDVQLKLLKDADDYKGLIDKATCMRAYRTLLSVSQGCAKNKARLSSLVKKDKEVHEGVKLMKRKIKRFMKGHLKLMNYWRSLRTKTVHAQLMWLEPLAAKQFGLSGLKFFIHMCLMHIYSL